MSSIQALPIESVIPNILDTITHHHTAIIQAPPGAGKTTLVPLALLSAKRYPKKILLIQPRRLAVYGAAQRMAKLLNEHVGATIGYTTRYDQKKSPETRIEVVTEGIFLRLIQQDPELTGISCVIFDEFHERSVAADLGLAFAVESQLGFRDETHPLKLIVMSATLDGDKLSDWLQAPLIKSEGRSFPVETFHHPLPANQPLETHIAHLIALSLHKQQGSVLVFLPGMREIKRVSDTLKTHSLPQQVTIYPLHASLPQDQQQQAIAAAKDNEQKVVLTTNVAETSITIEGIRTVIDSGLVRVSKYDERRGMDHLVTEKVSVASAEQRRGRAGRIAAGFCHRCWSETEQRQMKAFSEPEITHADLLPIALELANWGCQDATELMLLTQPNKAALRRAQQTLIEMGALNPGGQLTTNGTQILKMGLHPRLANLIVVSRAKPYESSAILAAAILSEGDPIRFHQQWPQSDLSFRLNLWQSASLSMGSLHKATWQRIKLLSKQLSQRAGAQWQVDTTNHFDIGIALAHTFPEHVAQLRQNHQTRYLMANGKGVQLNPEDTLAGSEYLIVLDASGKEQEPFIRLACPLVESQLYTALERHFDTKKRLRWNDQKNQIEAHRVTRLHELVVAQEPLESIDPEEIQSCLVNTIRERGLQLLPWNDSAEHLRSRVRWLHQQQPDDWPAWDNQSLVTELENWLLPFLPGIKTLAQLKAMNLTEALKSALPWEQWQPLEQLAPDYWILPTGQKKRLEYDSEQGPTLSARMQEFYGLKEQPMLPGGQKITLQLCSPANRPIQITQDIVGFWQGSYIEVAKEMRGRYPKHFWPEDPANAQATTKTKKYL
ncbi:MAG: ATP-dependent helicase HrpB [Pseudomonadales bacterium]|nr:ATP-dependent helicase HrpB [Pseudomonadales bacterium]